MAWVRYDDGFHDHDKTAVVRHECPEALALHLLANTWTSRTSRPGFVPAAVPFTLIGSKVKARKWSGALVDAGLWVVAEGGWEFVNHEKYRRPDSRQTPGTPADLSEKRAEAGRRGGRSTASKRQATGAAKPATGSSIGKQASSKPCSPVVASNEATPEPVQTSSGSGEPPVETTGQRANRLTKTYTDLVPMSAFLAVQGVVTKAIKAGKSDGEITSALVRLAENGRSVTVDTLRIEIEGPPRRAVVGPRQAPPGSDPHKAHLWEQA